MEAMNCRLRGRGKETEMSDGPNTRPSWKIRLAAWAWELAGLLLVLALGGGLLMLLSGSLAEEQKAIEGEKGRAAEGRSTTLIPVIVKVLRPETVLDAISLPGQVQAVQSLTISTQVKGRVLSVDVLEGRSVKKGDLLCRIDDSDYRIALDEAEAALRLASQNLEKTRKLVKSKIESESILDRDRATFEQARARVASARLAVERCSIHSPMDGVVEDVLPEPGEFLPSEKAVAVLLDVSRVKVEVGIPEQDIDSVRSVKTCSLKVDALDGLEIEGAVTYLSHRPAQQTLVYMLRMEVDNGDGRLRPGMFVEARIVKERREGAIKVPLFAVLARRDAHFLYVLDESDGSARVRERPVSLGIMQGRHVEIRGGVKAGEKVVVVGQRAVADGGQVRVMKTVKSMGELLR